MVKGFGEEYRGKGKGPDIQTLQKPLPFRGVWGYRSRLTGANTEENLIFDGESEVI